MYNKVREPGSREQGHTVSIVNGNGFPLAVKKINRNAKCECNSGKKAKHCCGTKTKYCYSKLNERQIEERQREAEKIKNELE